MDRDYKKDAWALHLAFHEYNMIALNIFAKMIEDRWGKEERAKFDKEVGNIHSTFDTVINWVDTLSDELLKKEAAIEELRNTVLALRLYGDRRSPHPSEG